MGTTFVTLESDGKFTAKTGSQSLQGTWSVGNGAMEWRYSGKVAEPESNVFVECAKEKFSLRESDGSLSTYARSTGTFPPAGDDIPVSVRQILEKTSGRLAAKVRKWGSCTAANAPWKPGAAVVKMTPAGSDLTKGKMHFYRSDQTADYTLTDFSATGAELTIFANGNKMYRDRIRFADGEFQYDGYFSGCADISFEPAKD